MAIPALIGAAASAAAASPILSFRSADLDVYLAAVDGAEQRLEQRCAALMAGAPAAGAVWFRIGPGGLEIAPQDAAAAEASAFWADLALGAREAARALYGAAAGETLPDGPVMVELSGAAASVFDGATRREGDLCDAMARLAGALGGVAGDNPFRAARKAAAPPAAAPLPIGGSVEVTLAAPPPEGAVLKGPVGVTAERLADGALRLKAGAGAAPGDAQLRVYAPEDPFRPVETVALRLLPGRAAPARSASGALAPGGAYAGRVEPGGVVALSVTLSEARTVTFASHSHADLTAVLETEGGERVAAADDSGGDYDFTLSAALPAGAYVLKVTHCCGGDGDFAVSATSE